MAAFLSLTHKMAAWEFCLQDGGISEDFTHKMAAWKFCLQDGGNGKQTKRKQKQGRICIKFTVWNISIEGHVTVRQFNV